MVCFYVMTWLDFGCILLVQCVGGWVQGSLDCVFKLCQEYVFALGSYRSDLSGGDVRYIDDTPNEGKGRRAGEQRSS